jgi:hypothetical protein
MTVNSCVGTPCGRIASQSRRPGEGRMWNPARHRASMTQRLPGPETPRRFLLSSPCGGSENVRKNRWASLCRPFRPRFCLSHETTRLRAWLRTSGASRLVHLPARSKNKVGNDFRASLEEAAVSRPGREAGKKNGQNQRAPKVRPLLSTNSMEFPERIQNGACWRGLCGIQSKR